MQTPPTVVRLCEADAALIAYDDEAKRITYGGACDVVFQTTSCTQLFGVTSGWTNSKPDKLAATADVAAHVKHAFDARNGTVRLKGATDASVADEDFGAAAALQAAVVAQTPLEVAGFARPRLPGSDYPPKIGGLKVPMAAVKNGALVLRSDGVAGAAWQLEKAVVLHADGAVADDPLAFLAANPRGTLLFSLDAVPYGVGKLSVKPVLRVFRASAADSLEPRVPQNVPAILDDDETPRKRAKLASTAVGANSSLGGFGC